MKKKPAGCVVGTVAAGDIGGEVPFSAREGAGFEFMDFILDSEGRAA
jgi:hypothetical protein